VICVTLRFITTFVHPQPPGLPVSPPSNTDLYNESYKESEGFSWKSERGNSTKIKYWYCTYKSLIYWCKFHLHHKLFHLKLRWSSMPNISHPNVCHIKNCLWQIYKYEGNDSKKRAKLSLFVIKHHAIKTYGTADIQLPAFLTSPLDGGEWSVPCTSCFIPLPGRNPDTNWIGGWENLRWVISFMPLSPYPQGTVHITKQTGGWVGPRTSLNIVEKRKISYPCWKLDLTSPAVQLYPQSLYQLSYPGTWSGHYGEEKNLCPCHVVCMYKGWAFTALAPRPTVVYCA
jgi:hypothetical protein